MQDSYKSILEAFTHAGAENEVRVNVRPIHSEHLTPENVKEKLSRLHGVLVAPGFGERGTAGKIAAVSFARENNIPFLGICLGMQMAVIEFARNVLGMPKADSTEMNSNTPNAVINLMKEQKSITDMGGTMRLGAWDCKLDTDSLAYKIYQNEMISVETQTPLRIQ